MIIDEYRARWYHWFAAPFAMVALWLIMMLGLLLGYVVEGFKRVRGM